MGTIQNDSFYSSYLGDQIDLLLAAMAQANPLPSGTDWVAFIDDCRAAQSRAEAAAELAEAWSAHPPYIGANGNWWVYNATTQQFVDSGVDASITVDIEDITMLPTDADPSVTNTGTNTDPIFHLFIPRGATGLTGDTGNGISAAVLNANYTLTLTFTDGTSYTTPSIRGAKGDTGNGITSIAKTGTSGLTDTYTITFDDSTTATFTVTNGAKGDTGNGISGISLTTTAGLVDTYTISYTDGTSDTFTVTNGANGVSPAVEVSSITGGHRVTITDADHPSGQAFNVMDGVDGDDGYSPVVSVTAITGGHRVTITDATHPSGQSFDVMDGTGDMVAATYDPQGTVAAAGGIPDYVSANGSKPVQVYVNLSATWSGTGPYTQTVTVSGVTANSEVSLRPNATQLQQLIDDGVQALYVENDNGTCTAVAVGAAPSVAMKLVAEVTEVVPAPQPLLNKDVLTLGDSEVWFTAYPSIKWQVQHLSGDYAYLALAEMTELTVFGSNATYLGSTISAKCEGYLANTIPNVSQSLETVTVNGVTNKVFVPSREQLEEEWDYPMVSSAHCICKYNGTNYSWWTSSRYSSNYAYMLTSAGSISTNNRVSDSIGFRPCVKVKYK